MLKIFLEFYYKCFYNNFVMGEIVYDILINIL